MTSAAAARPLRVLYLGWKRDRWRALLRELPGLEVVELDLRLRDGSLAPRLARLARAIRTAARGEADLVVSETIGFEGSVGLLLRRLSGAPLAVRLKGDPWAEAEERGHGLRPLERLVRRLNFAAASLVLDSADAVLPISAPLALRSARELGPRSRGPLPNQLVPGEAAPARPQTPSLLTVTNFAFDRKLEPLRAAALRLGPCLSPLGLHWTILGGGRHLPDFRRLTAPFRDRIHLPGFLPVRELYAERPIVLYFTGLDALPNALLEAAVAGLPIVVNRGGPVDWFCEDKVDGIVCTADELPLRIHDLLADPALRERLGQNARQRVHQRFGAEPVGSAVLAELHRIARRD